MNRALIITIEFNLFGYTLFPDKYAEANCESFRQFMWGGNSADSHRHLMTTVYCLS